MSANDTEAAILCDIRPRGVNLPPQRGCAFRRIRYETVFRCPRSHTCVPIPKHSKRPHLRSNRAPTGEVSGSSATWRPMCGAAEARTAHPEKTRRERHLRSSRTFQRDRPSPSNAGSSVRHSSEHTVAFNNAANHPSVSTPNRSRVQVMWVIHPRSRASDTVTTPQSVAADPGGEVPIADTGRAVHYRASLLIGVGNRGGCG